MTGVQAAALALLGPFLLLYGGILIWGLWPRYNRKPRKQPRKQPSKAPGKHRKPPGAHATGYKHARRKAAHPFRNLTHPYPRKAHTP